MTPQAPSALVFGQAFGLIFYLKIFQAPSALNRSGLRPGDLFKR
jgi:hypothetical protein